MATDSPLRVCYESYLSDTASTSDQPVYEHNYLRERERKRERGGRKEIEKEEAKINEDKS